MARSDLLSDGYDVLNRLAEEGRATLSQWRAHLYLRRGADPYYPPDRAARVVSKLEGAGLVESLSDRDRNPIYRATSPYAPAGVNPHEAAVEAYYSGALCFGTALEVHRLSEQRARTLHVFVPRSPSGEVARRAAPARAGAVFTLRRTHGQAHHWTLSADGETLAVSGDAYARRADDLHAIDVFRTHAVGAPVDDGPLSGDGAYDTVMGEGAAFELYRSPDGAVRWRFRTALDDVVARAARGAATEAEAVAAVDRVREAIEAAPVEEEVDVTGLLPLDTTPEDWRLYPLPSFVRLTEIDGYAVDVHNVKPAWLFGLQRGTVRGAPVRLTDRERTLLDGLRYPKHCGGLGEVFRAWVRWAEADADRGAVDRLVDYSERFDQRILYQRAGFVLETLGLAHPRLAHWKEHQVVRGGSRLLDPDAPYSPDFSEGWGLSINYPTGVLEERDGSTS